MYICIYNYISLYIYINIYINLYKYNYIYNIYSVSISMLYISLSKMLRRTENSNPNSSSAGALERDDIFPGLGQP